MLFLHIQEQLELSLKKQGLKIFESKAIPCYLYFKTTVLFFLKQHSLVSYKLHYGTAHNSSLERVRIRR